MGLNETLLIGFGATLVQSYWRCNRKPTFIQLLFNLSVISLSAGVSHLLFTARLTQSLLPNHVLRVASAAVVYFVWNTSSVSIIIGLTERLSAWNVWRKSYMWSFPHYALGASVVCAIDFASRTMGVGVTLLILPAAYLVYRTFEMHMTKLSEALERVEREKRHIEETASLHLRTIRALALAIEAKDQTTGEHLHRVQTYAIELGKDFGLPPHEMEALRAAAILHDVGKLAVPEHIISKPGKLTPEEFRKMKIHTIVGAEIVESVNFPFAVAPLVRSHHEKWDGSGYPDGLRGGEIPLGARILTAVDCLDALASDRQYRQAMPLDQAMSIVAAESGRSFDPRVVEALNKRCHELENLAKSTLQQDPVKLSIDEEVHRGLAPDAGYAAGSHIAGLDCQLTQSQLTRELSILNRLRSQIGKFESIQADLSAIEPQLRKLIPFDCMALYRRRGDGLECIFAKGDAASLLVGLSIKPGVGASGWTLANRTPLPNGNAAAEFGVMGPVPSGFALVSSLSIPLESERGPIGTFTLYSRQRDPFHARHLRALLAISSLIAYQLNLNLVGVARAIPDAGHADLAREAPVGVLLEAINSDSALSPVLVSRQN